MVATTNYRNPERTGLVKELEKAASKEEAGIWKAVAEALSRSRKNRPEVNIYRINKHTQDGDVVVVPGNVIGSGKLAHKVDVAAFKFTEGAKKEIISSGGKVLTIPELIRENARGSGVKILS